LLVFRSSTYLTRHFWKKPDIIFGKDLLDGDNRMELPYFAVGRQNTIES